MTIPSKSTVFIKNNNIIKRLNIYGDFDRVYLYTISNIYISKIMAICVDFFGKTEEN